MSYALSAPTSPKVVAGGTILNVYSGELLKGDVTLRGERIWYVGASSPEAGSDAEVLDVTGKVLVPGYVEPHAHPWNVYNPISLGEEACRLGTTTLFYDNLFYYMLMGLDLFETFMTALSDMPVKFFWSCRAVPQTPMEGEDETFSIDNLKRLLKNRAVQSLGEITRWPDLVNENPKILEVIKQTKLLRKRVDGHTAGAKYEKLNAVSRAGVDSCHESVSPEDVLDRLRLGFWVMLRESSLRPDLRHLSKAIGKNRILTDRIMLTTDGSSPEFYHRFGISDHVINIAIEEGIDPVEAYRMSTIHPATYFGLDHEIGGIAPGRCADILVLKDLHHPTPEMVISRGRVVAENGVLKEPFPDVDWKTFFPKSLSPRRDWRAEKSFFMIPCPGKRVKFPTIKLVNPVITRKEWVEFEVEDGSLRLHRKDLFCFVALLNREGRWVTNGVLQGFDNAVEGLATSFNTAAEILVIGRDPDAMSAAVNRVLEIDGGIVAMEKGEIVYELPLPLGGIMSAAPMRELAKKEGELKAFLSDRGHAYHDPFYTFTFLPNDFLPDVRINYKGVFDIREGKTLWPRRDLL